MPIAFHVLFTDYKDLVNDRPCIQCAYVYMHMCSEKKWELGRPLQQYSAQKVKDEDLSSIFGTYFEKANMVAYIYERGTGSQRQWYSQDSVAY